MCLRVLKAVNFIPYTLESGVYFSLLLSLDLPKKDNAAACGLRTWCTVEASDPQKRRGKAKESYCTVPLFFKRNIIPGCLEVQKRSAAGTYTRVARMRAAYLTTYTTTNAHRLHLHTTVLRQRAWMVVKARASPTLLGVNVRNLHFNLLYSHNLPPLCSSASLNDGWRLTNRIPMVKTKTCSHHFYYFRGMTPRSAKLRHPNILPLLAALYGSLQNQIAPPLRRNKYSTIPSITANLFRMQIPQRTPATGLGLTRQSMSLGCRWPRLAFAVTVEFVQLTSSITFE